LFLRVEQLVTPGDGPIDRLLTLWQVACADAREKDVVLEPMEQVIRRQYLHPGCGQFERERQCIEPSADRDDGAAVARGQPKGGLERPDPFDEELHGGNADEISRRDDARVRLARERSDRVEPFPAHAERGATGGEDAERCGRRHEIGDHRRRLQDLLAVIEQQQDWPFLVARHPDAPRQVDRSDVGQAQSFGDGGRHERGITHAGQLDEHRAGRAGVRDATSDLEGQPRLSDSPGTQKRNQPGTGITQPIVQRLQVGVAPDEARQRQRK
jgi:hypothetical protein